MSSNKNLHRMLTVLSVLVILFAAYGFLNPTTPVVYRSYSTGEVVRIEKADGHVIFKGHMPMKKLTIDQYDLVWVK